MSTTVTYLSNQPPAVDLGAEDYTGHIAPLPGLMGWWSLYDEFAAVDAGRVTSVAPRAGQGHLIRAIGANGPALAANGPYQGASFGADTPGDHLISDFTLPGDNWGCAMVVYENGQHEGNYRVIGGVGISTGTSYARRSGGRWSNRGATDTVVLSGVGYRLVTFDQVGTQCRIRAHSRSASGGLLAGTYTAGWLPGACNLFVGNGGTEANDWPGGIMEVWLFEGGLLDRPDVLAEISKYAKEVYFDAE